MAESIESYLLELWDQNICPNCGKTIPQGTRVGSGRKSEGSFCSLDCYTSFYQLELAERARRVAERTKRKES
jgi:predicted nucleic acid-binding Zn ribbon protein